MASNIKGIVIEIEGKTSGLVKSLKDVDSSIKDTQAALKKVNEALKLDPKNVTLVAEKQKLLADQIQNTEQKLKLLEQAAADASQALANGEISEAEYAQLAAEVEITRQNLEKLTAEANNVRTVGQAFEEVGQKIQDVGKKVEDVGEKTKTFGENMTKNVTAPIIAGAAAATGAFVEVDKSLDIIIKKTGATGEDLNELEGIFNNIAKTVPADLNTIASAVGEVNTRFGVTGDDLEELSTLFIEFASINNTDVSTSVDNVQKALAAFGLPASEAEAMLDKLTQTSQSTGANVDTLTQGLIQNATAFEELDLSMEQSIEFMGQLETSGVNSETAMQGLRKALKSSAEDGVDLNTALSDLQNAILNGTDDMDGLTLAYETFGKSGDQIYGALQNGTLDFTAMGQAASDAGGTVTNTFNATVDPVTKMKTATNSLKLTLGAVGETIAGMVAPAVEKLADAIENINEWWNSLSDSQREFILGALAVVAAIGPVIAFIGNLITTVGMAITVVGTITTALGTTGLAATFVALAPVIGSTIAVIAAVVAIGWGLYEIITGLIDIFNNWDVVTQTVGESVNAVFGGIGDWWSEKTAGIQADIDLTAQGFEAFKEDASASLETLKTNASEKWETMKSTALDALNNMKENASEKVDAIGGFFSGLGESALTWGADLLQGFIDGIKSLWNSFTGTINDITGYIADNLGFSEPDEGPLSRFHTFAPDMIDLWNKGIYDNLDKVQMSSEVMANTVATGVQQPTDYSGALNGISGQLSSMAGNGQAINVYIGNDRLGTAIARSNARAAYISGGH